MASILRAEAAEVTVDDLLLNAVRVPMNQSLRDAAIAELPDHAGKPRSILISASESGFPTTNLFLPYGRPPSVYLVGIHHGNHFGELGDGHASQDTALMLERVGRFLLRVSDNGLMPYPSIIGVEWLSTNEYHFLTEHPNKSQAWNRLLQLATSGVFVPNSGVAMHVEGNANPMLIYRMGSATEERSREELEEEPTLRRLTQEQLDQRVRASYSLEFVTQRIVPHIADVLQRPEQPKSFFYVMGTALLFPTERMLQQRDIPYASVFMR